MDRIKLLLQFHPVWTAMDETHRHGKHEANFALGISSFAGGRKAQLCPGADVCRARSDLCCLLPSKPQLCEQPPAFLGNVIQDYYPGDAVLIALQVQPCRHSPPTRPSHSLVPSSGKASILLRSKRPGLPMACWSPYGWLLWPKSTRTKVYKCCCDGSSLSCSRLAGAGRFSGVW